MRPPTDTEIETGRSLLARGTRSLVVLFGATSLLAACGTEVVDLRATGASAGGSSGPEGTSAFGRPVAVSGLQSCAITAPGAVRCWGGDGAVVPSEVPGLASGVVVVAAGQIHACALAASGTVECWGNSAHGQLGDGSTTESLAPVEVTGLSSPIGVVAGGFHTCALTASRTVECWGMNAAGELGDGSTTDRLVPVAVAGLPSGVVALAAGDVHSCALTKSGGVKCWGDNEWGQLGDGSTTERHVPVDVAGLSSGVVSITCGDSHSCAITSLGAVRCWGRNDWGQLGNGSKTASSGPVEVAGLPAGVVALAAGVEHTCALTSSGAVLCWGANQWGQLGDGSTTARLVPVDVAGLSSGAVTLAAGGGDTCAATSSGKIECWGFNDAGQLGDGSTTNGLVPVEVLGF